MRRRPRSVSMSSNLSAAAACSYSQVTHRSSQPSSLEDAAKVSLDDDSVDEAEQGATGDEVMIEDKCDDESSYPSGVLTPFQLLLVNKRLADLTASPELLVKALECLGSRCQDQVQVLDLHANEKMQAAGLESPAELQRLFSSGFSQLRYLRLQGGLLDNQLLGALIKGFSAPLAQPCQLSHVFLGPGSVTDSAIDNLIAVAGHCLEVFTVTSCVDFSGGALASLLTKCPKLRVLSVHRALARDKELLEELGVEIESNAPPSNSSALVTLNQHEPSRKEIIAPLERLELGTVKLTTVGISEIIRGTYQSLRFLVLETQHFKEDFLIDVVAKLYELEEPWMPFINTHTLHSTTIIPKALCGLAQVYPSNMRTPRVD
ncbi:hypothetical protein BGZ58_006668 [Dissophora ornata]|nr:hypothetical protein BGZ58_006668 [Dissophora ornata]